MSDVDNSQNVSEPQINGAPTAPAASNAESAPANQGGSDPADSAQADPADAPEGERFQKSSDYKRISRQRANAERRAMRAEAELAAIREQLRANSTPQQQRSAELKASDFASYDEYVRAQAREEARQAARQEVAATRQELAAAAVQRQAEATRDSFEKEARAEAKAAGIDFDDAWEVLTDKDTTVSETVADYLFNAEHKAALAAHLANDLDELARLSQLHPAQANRELAKLDAKLGAPKAKPNATKAPPPVPTVGGRAVTQFDPQKASIDEYADNWHQRQERLAGRL